MAEAAAALPDVKARAWREAFTASGLPVAPMVEGVRQDSLANLHRTLVALSKEYEAAEPQRREKIRRLAITARQHAEWATRAAGLNTEKQEEKLEQLLWIRTWLENPPLFPAWASIRLRARVN